MKVLDFGLAKGYGTEASTTSAHLSISPTIMSPAATQMGFILGTAAYMSPEQAKGKAVDRRADMWAFGCVLFEMLTATRPFGGDDVTDTIAYVITKEPDWNALPPQTPPALLRLMRRCLVKDPKHRLAGAARARREIEGAQRERQTPAAPMLARGGMRWWWAAAIGVAALAVGAVGMGTVLGRRPSPPPQTVRFTLELPPNVQLYANASQRVAVTNDGRRIVYTREENSAPGPYVRDIDSLESTPIRGVERAGSIFLSPDGQWIGFNDTANGPGRPRAVLCGRRRQHHGRHRGYDARPGARRAATRRRARTLLLRPVQRQPGVGHRSGREAFPADQGCEQRPRRRAARYRRPQLGRRAEAAGAVELTCASRQ